MDEHAERSVEERLARLEATVALLEERLEALQSAPKRAAPRRPASPEAPRMRPTPPASHEPSPQGDGPFNLDFESENWLSRIGIGLTLFGVAFLFRYSVDQGWLTPPVQVALGFVLGAALIGPGLLVRQGRERLGQMLLGGGVATLYATIFAAYQLYGLVAYPLAFAGMAAVTVGAFMLAVQKGDAALAVVGVLGALGTPFLLYTEAGSLPGLVGYTCLVLAGACAVYLQKGWRALLYTAVLGGWLTLGFAFLNLPGGWLSGADGDVLDPDLTGLAEPSLLWPHVAVQLGVLFAWLAFWSVPTLREVKRGTDRAPEEKASASLLGAFLFRPPTHTLAFSSPLLALAFSRALWVMPDVFWSAVTLGGAAVYAAAYAGLRRTGLGRLAQAHGLVAAVLLAYGLSELLGGDTFVLALAAEAAALHLLARRMGDRSLRATGHVFFAVVAATVAERLLFEGAGRPALVNAAALTQLGALLLAAGVSVVLLDRQAKWAYRLGAHVLLLGWLLRELSALPGGQAYASIAWGVYAVALLVAGLSLGRVDLRSLALATLLLLVAKLFLVDLATLEALWRVLLFLGLGGAFLLLSYFLPGVFPDRFEKGERESG